MTIATEAQIDAFLKVLDPQDDSTGGGAASAVTGAMGAGLAGMVARVSKGKPDMEPDEFYDEIDERAQQLTRELLAGAADDSTAFEAVMAGFRMPKDTDEQKAARSTAIQDGLEKATEVPLVNGERCTEVLKLVERLAPKHNVNAASDLDVGRRLALAALEGCIDNVEINLGSLKREAACEAFTRRLEALRAAATAVMEGA
ncbi:MAG TPA: cyclodeaminase/cyclohydrolase family protein [Gemmatimonadota bacterium]|nr:cyclodeaminase/cyclohydrolase family protein [Gemmatimonadota bacterium]